MSEKTIKELAVELTIEVTNICDDIKNRKVYTNQIMRSCSSIGANVHEAKYAQSRADFIHKMFKKRSKTGKDFGLTQGSKKHNI